MNDRIPRTDKVFFGTYTSNTDSRGVYLARFDAEAGVLSEPELASEATDPSFLAVHPVLPVLYATDVDRKTGNPKCGAVSGFAVEADTNKLRFVGQYPTGCASPCHITVDAAGRHVLFASYHDAYAGVLGLDENGAPVEGTALLHHEGSGPNPDRQESAHPHSVNLTPDQKFALVADLGIDRVVIYRFDSETGALSDSSAEYAAVVPGAGPRHLAFHPNGLFAFLINELDSTIVVFAYDESSGSLAPLQTVPALPPGFTGENTTAEIAIHPNGRLLYGSNRGDDSLVCYAVDPVSGKLSRPAWTPTQGRTPRHFAIHPNGRFLLAAHENSGNVVVMRVDPESGALEHTGHEISVPGAVCVRFF